MTLAGSNAPARLWRAFLLTGVLLAAGATAAPASKSNRPAPNFVQLSPPDQAEGGRILQEFRSLGIAGDYYLEFVLKVRPRRGEEKDFRGQLWGSRNTEGPISRVVLHDDQDQVQRLLIQNGPAPQVWAWHDGQPTAATASLDRLFTPLLPETDLTLFDLQMPYLYWNDYVFEGVSKMRGRAAHTFLLYPPAEIATRYPELKGVRVYLDTQYHALVEADLINADDQSYKTLSLLDLKKVDDQWMIKTIDLRNDETRNKTRFQVTRAALGLDLLPQVFSPESLSAPIRPPARTVSLGQ